MGKFYYFFLGNIISMVVMYITTYFLHSKLDDGILGDYYLYVNNFTLLYPIFCICIFNGYLRFGHNKDIDVLVVKLSVVGILILSFIIFMFTKTYLSMLFVLIIPYQAYIYRIRYDERIVDYLLANVIQKVTLLCIVIIYLFYYSYYNAEIIFSFIGISYLLSVIILFTINIARKGNDCTLVVVNAEYINKKDFINYAFSATILCFVSWGLLVSDQLIINHYYDSSTVAPYAVAYKISSLVSVVTGVIIAYYPVVYFKELNVKYLDVSKKLRILLIFLLSVIVMFVFIFTDLTYFIFGSSEYIKYGLYLKLLILAELFRSIGACLLVFNTYELKLKLNIYISCLVLFINFIINVVFIEEYGPVVASYSTLISYALYFIFGLSSYAREKKYLKKE
ncbi:lipopolysaccharide biosynthesis protein [Aliivibrio wodanis]|uniref:lipopolysaccharide biosynthesis protein n=1 Tax=Aliivibrio wodanis TaxID=80852 RepID=UPI00406CDC1E